MKKKLSKQTSTIAAIVLSTLAFVAFLLNSHLIANSLVMIIIAIFIIAPYRKVSEISNRLLLMFSLVFIGWIGSSLGMTLLPFLISFIIAYILDPIVVALERKHIPRWMSAILVVFGFVGVISAIAIFVFPAIFDQLDTVIKRISFYVKQTTDYVESDRFYKLLRSFGLPKETVKSLVHEQLLPKLESILSIVFNSLLSLLNSLSAVATQIVNAIIIPVLTFYFLKDFGKMQQSLKSILIVKNEKLLNDLRRINLMLRKYIGWQVLAAFIVGTVSSLVYSVFGVPYPIVIGVLAGLLNPIPYVSIVLSMAVGALTILLVNEGNVLEQIIVVVANISILHFINAYFLEPQFAGKQVGLHPLLLIISLFVFGGLFGFIGLLIAVPVTAVLMMFFNDWRKNLIDKHKQEELKESEIVSEATE